MEQRDVTDLSAIISIVFMLGIIIAFMSYRMFKLRFSASLCLGILVSYLFLNIMYPIGILMYERRSFVITIYLAIECIVPIYLIIYLIISIMSTHRD